MTAGFSGGGGGSLVGAAEASDATPATDTTTRSARSLRDMRSPPNVDGWLDSPARRLEVQHAYPAGVVRQRRRRRSRGGVWIGVALVVVLAAAFAASVLLLSGASLAEDGSALARVRTELFAGRIASVRAFAPDGTAIPLVVSHGRLTPRSQLEPGETVSVRVVVRRPGWSAWALGQERHERLTVQTPVAHVVDRWPTGRRIRFDRPVSAVEVGGRNVAASTTVVIPSTKTSGAVNVAAAVRPWERLGQPVRVTWFPKSERPVVLASPAPGAQLDPLEPLRLTFSQRVSLDDHPR